MAPTASRSLKGIDWDFDGTLFHRLPPPSDADIAGLSETANVV
jgi:hypothetical protein